MMMLALLFAQTAALSLSQARAMTPVAMGEAVLHDRQHGPIETFEWLNGQMNAPGTISGQLVEQPVASASGCVRRRWTVHFRAAPGADINTATMADQYSTWEIAPSYKGGCPVGGYAHLNPDLSVERGWEALAHLKEVRDGGKGAQFQCSDTTASNLCHDRKAILSGLRGLSPWAITLEAKDLVIWLGKPGGIVTEARFPSDNPAKVIVTRRVPAPA